jgi:hypothetical protein
MNPLDLLQDRKINWLIAGFAILGSVVAVVAYIDQKKHNHLQKEVIELDRELKRLQLEKIKNGN